jgi:hypothetical protein
MCVVSFLTLSLLWLSTIIVSLSVLRLSNVFVHSLFIVQAEMHVDHIQLILLQN